MGIFITECIIRDTLKQPKSKRRYSSMFAPDQQAWFLHEDVSHKECPPGQLTAMFPPSFSAHGQWCIISCSYMSNSIRHVLRWVTLRLTSTISTVLAFYTSHSTESSHFSMYFVTSTAAKSFSSFALFLWRHWSSSDSIMHVLRWVKSAYCTYSSKTHAN